MYAWLKDRLGWRLVQAIKYWIRDDAGLLSAAISYYAALSFFPLLLVLISGLGLFLRFSGWGRGSRTRILELIAHNSSAQLADQVKNLLQNIERHALIGGPLGLITLVLAALALFVNFQHALDRIWKVESQKKGYLAVAKASLLNRLRAFLMLMALGLLVLLTFAAGMAISAVAAQATVALGDWRFWQAGQVVVTLVLNFGLITLMYRVLTKVRVPWSAAAQGATLAALTWEIGRQLLSAWIIGSQYGAYGVVGSFIALLLWTYYAIAVILLGAEYSRVVYERQCAATALDESPQE